MLNPGLLDKKRNNYIAALTHAGDMVGLAVADVSTGQLVCTELDPTKLTEDDLTLAAGRIAAGRDDARRWRLRWPVRTASSPGFPRSPWWPRRSAVCTFYSLVALEGLGHSLGRRDGSRPGR